MPRVIVIGGANVDIKGRSDGSVIPGTSNPGRVTVSAGGVGRNIAENLARLGIETALVTALGDDVNGHLLREACAAANVDLSMALKSKVSTGSYLALLDESGELVSAINDMRAVDALTATYLARHADDLAAADMLVADCNLSALCLDWLCRFASEQGVRLVVEPVSVPKAMKLLAFARKAPVFAITPNLQQLKALTSGTMAIPQLHRIGFANVVLHRGSAGALVSDGREEIEVPPVRVEAIADVTGAGDAAVAGLVCGLLDARPLAEAARLGQCAAAIKLSSSQSVASGLSRDSLYRLASLPMVGRD